MRLSVLTPSISRNASKTRCEYEVTLMLIITSIDSPSADVLAKLFLIWTVFSSNLSDELSNLFTQTMLKVLFFLHKRFS